MTSLCCIRCRNRYRSFLLQCTYMNSLSSISCPEEKTSIMVVKEGRIGASFEYRTRYRSFYLDIEVFLDIPWNDPLSPSQENPKDRGHHNEGRHVQEARSSSFRPQQPSRFAEPNFAPPFLRFSREFRSFSARTSRAHVCRGQVTDFEKKMVIISGTISRPSEVLLRP